MSLAFNQSGYAPMNMSPFAAHMFKVPAMTLSTATETIPLENRPPIKATFISLYALIFFFGISGNALVVREY
jgi:hypothetical protein